MSNKYLLYVGTYTNPYANPNGIYVFSFDSSTAQLERIGEVGGIESPSYLTINHEGRYLYAVSEVVDWPEGTLTAYAINHESGELTFLNRQSTKGSSTAYVSLDNTNAYALVANYGGGQSVAMLPINTDGSLEPASSSHKHTGKPAGVVSGRQEQSHAHSIMPDPTNTYAFACNLGLDKILSYRMDVVDGRLELNDLAFCEMPPGAGPRHLAFHPNQTIAYATNELNSSVSVLSFNSGSGILEVLQTISTLPDHFEGHNTCSDIHVTPDGNYLYAGNRGHDSLAIFAIDDKSRRLTAVGYQSTKGKTPRNFAIDPAGAFVLAANQNSDSIVVFQIDKKTGLLIDTDIVIECPTPTCLKLFVK